MKVKIGSVIYDSDHEPIMVILTQEEKDLVSNMGDQVKFCSFPHGSDVNVISEFMK